MLGGLLTRRGDPQGGVLVVLSLRSGEADTAVAPESKMRLSEDQLRLQTGNNVYLLLTSQMEARHSLKTKHLHILHNNFLIMQARLVGSVVGYSPVTQLSAKI